MKSRRQYQTEHENRSDFSLGIDLIIIGLIGQLILLFGSNLLVAINGNLILIILLIFDPILAMGINKLQNVFKKEDKAHDTRKA